jgi:hypothetical protein
MQSILHLCQAREFFRDESIIKHLQYYALIELKPMIQTTAERALKVIQWSP